MLTFSLLRFSDSPAYSKLKPRHLGAHCICCVFTLSHRLREEIEVERGGGREEGEQEEERGGRGREGRDGDGGERDRREEEGGG